jgi:Ca2+-binding EF-hand superfamily protein
MRYVAAFSLLCIAFEGACSVKPAPQSDREHLISSASVELRYWDKDGDGKLSRAEVAAMVDYAIRRAAKDFLGGKITPDLENRRQELLRSYASQDTNHDGYLTLDELLKEPLASFDCMDANHDGKLSKDELSSGCASVNHYTPRP